MTSSLRRIERSTRGPPQLPLHHSRLHCRPKTNPIVVPMLFSQSQTAASPKSIGGWQKLLSRSFQMGGCVPMGADSFLRRSLSTGKGSLSRGNNRSRRLLCELKVFPANSLLRASLSWATGMDRPGNGTDSMWDVIGVNTPADFGVEWWVAFSVGTRRPGGSV